MFKIIQSLSLINLILIFSGFFGCLSHLFLFLKIVLVSQTLSNFVPFLNLLSGLTFSEIISVAYLSKFIVDCVSLQCTTVC